jgi:hypothetical protein
MFLARRTGQGRYEAPPDGKTLTLGDATGDQMLVLDRA